MANAAALLHRTWTLPQRRIAATLCVERAGPLAGYCRFASGGLYSALRERAGRSDDGEYSGLFRLAAAGFRSPSREPHRQATGESGACDGALWRVRRRIRDLARHRWT